MFDIDTCVAFITNSSAKRIAECFNDRLSKLGITRVQWIALYFMGKYENISQSELAEKMDIKASSVARLIDRMERDEYVIRQRDENDRRIIHLVLTEKGKELREKIMPEGEKMSKLASKGLTEEEIGIFKKVLEKMKENVEEVKK
ncbi:DNA-binding MarR family transcriptional regulator [Clostridium tetanomorphum]|uniref:MarR family transcriptional regulator n=1 Tax=Clostridium tetanomorphum TaxID=1553 RepID=A0A923IZH4_CLOTT|nr:MarR family transcriptional regulator [Clostridium tetanomorphum]KAJ53832.1 MarR family transcriptional regulator [Clostridium tetanomorphum DSM 665]MBC2397346.1 MarR family transcriptional regulator [Clostridium tetanomorphum]MBP1862566.1 DNA-binding MarR family transcriptional regulator [Clostridium tetanomorphum]NRS85593.1 DNA-binding MarR family transcriptional regulator [Clostridium tetanomorphum]NRZ96396.1 DNA-binding MarR family transcriptional regulator [Clostridium tetanomorphum]